MDYSGQQIIKVLVIAPFGIWPPHFGSSERIYNFVKQLANHDRIRLFVLYTDYAQVVSADRSQESWPNAELIAVGPSRRWAQAVNPFLVLKGLTLILREKPDVILCEHLWSSLHALALRVMGGMPLLLDDHNAEYIRFQRMGRKTSGIIRILETLACRFANKVICVSDADKEHLTRLSISASKICVVQNAVDTAQYRPNPMVRGEVRRELGLSDSSPMLLFFGKLDYQPNTEAVEIVMREIMPRVLERIPEAQFVICGYNPPVDRYDHRHVVFTGVVPRIEDYINACDVVIAPLISGGGTKLKIVQAIACGRPVITTSIGAEGIADAGEWMTVADQWEAFAAATVDVLADQASFHRGDLQSFRHAHSWETVAAQLAEVIEAQTPKGNR